MSFKDRTEAGKKLARRLEKYRKSDAVVIAIPRGGLVVGSAVARELKIPLDVALIKKIGHPGNPEFAVGAVSLTGRILNENVEVPEPYIESETMRLRKELKERGEIYPKDRKVTDIKGRPVILVDDGIATGSTIWAASELLRQKKCARIIVAVPVAPEDAINALKEIADEIVCLEIPKSLHAIGDFYDNFEQVSDEESIELLQR